MKKFSGWMIFWTIALIVNIIYTVVNIIDYKKINDDPIKNANVPNPCIPLVEWGTKFVGIEAGLNSSIAGIFFVSIILWLLYKNAPN